MNRYLTFVLKSGIGLMLIGCFVGGGYLIVVIVNNGWNGVSIILAVILLLLVSYMIGSEVYELWRNR